MKIERTFQDKTNFPHCLGSLDGKHAVLQVPFNSGNEYYNYKRMFTIVLLAIFDAKYSFTFANVGCQRRISDGFKKTFFYKKFIGNGLGIPEELPFLGQDIPMPYVLVAHNAFPLLNNFLKSFSGHHFKGSIERKFSNRVLGLGL